MFKLVLLLLLVGPTVTRVVNDLEDEKPEVGLVDRQNLDNRRLLSSGNQVIENAPGVGGWGGTCTCPNGQTYHVGDLNNYCRSLACYGGRAGTCNRRHGPGAGRKVICGSGTQISNGLGDVTYKIQEEIKSVVGDIRNLHNQNDCHCGSTGELQVRADGKEYRIRHGERKSITWRNSVRRVQWKCTHDPDWDSKDIGRHSKYWIVGFRHRSKRCCRSFWNCPGTTGRVDWF
jgi:hypothetical protein